ncbi:MAG: hypothetical protein ABIL37_02305 [candidate division WOR-3 bacterium]
MLDTILVIDSFRVFYKFDSVYNFSGFREIYRVKSNIIFRDISNRIVISVRGLEDKQNEIYLNNVKLNNPIWGFFYANALPLNLIGSSFVFLNDYRINLEISRNNEIGFVVGSYGKSSIYFRNKIFGFERTYNENNYKYWDNFNRQYFRKNNFEDIVGGFLNLRDFLIFFYNSKFGMPMRGYGNEGNDFEVFRGIILNYEKISFHYQFYQYNFEKPYETYSFSSNYFEAIFSNMESFHYRYVFKFPIISFDYISIIYDEGYLRYDYKFSKLFFIYPFSFEINLKRRLPNFSELYYKSNYALGNKSLSPENFYSFQFNIKNSFGLFFSYIQNPILWLPSGIYWQAQNKDYLFLYGIEVNVNNKFFNFSLSYIKNKLSDNMVLPYRPNLSFSITLNYYFSSFLKDQIVITYYSKRPTYYFPSSDYLNPILLVDYYKFFDFKKFFIYIYLKNLLNKSYEFIKGYPMESFSVNLKGGVRW